MKEYYLYEDSDLPKEGWIQCCIMCTLPTHNTLLYRRFKKKCIYSYICRKCSAKYGPDDALYNKYCIELELKLEPDSLCCLNTS